MFSALYSRRLIDGARVLDLFAGTGALGIEALSRGAASATFVEADPAAVRVVKANLAAAGLAGGTVVQADAMRFLASVGGGAGDGASGGFDLALVDPPYSYAAWPELLDALLVPLAMFESDREIAFGAGWEPLRPRRYGGTVVTLARRATHLPEGTVQ